MLNIDYLIDENTLMIIIIYFQYLDFDNLPETNFSCAGKVIGGYYADLETDCQMFHVCTIGQQEEPMDIKFLCLNGTVFDQVSIIKFNEIILLVDGKIMNISIFSIFFFSGNESMRKSR